MLGLTLVLLESRVMIHTRHGVRTPLKPMPFMRDPQYNSPMICKQLKYDFQNNKSKQISHRQLKLNFDVKNAVTGSCYAGQLTDFGFEQHVKLSDEWNRLYEFSYVNLRSTRYQRVRISLLGQLDHIYSSTSAPQPVSVGSAGFESLYLQDCSYDKQFQAFVIKNLDYHLIELQDLRVRTNTPDFEWMDYADNFAPYKQQNVALPLPITQSDVDLTFKINTLFWRNLYKNQNEQFRKYYLKMTIGTHVTEVLQFLCNPDSAFQINSGHDMTIQPLESILIVDGEFENGQVGFASFLNIEVESNYVKILFRGSDQEEGKYVNQRACGKIQCTVEEVEVLLKEYAIGFEERDRMCKTEFKE
ncbi:Acid_phosphatase [Hexamita inflata]|uniref:Acid phosphatase n=1 Tax=Hexamita inflata TaxID=28002 RepID=A0AA86TJF8_9EUKA|nr:Acid phosphatase [Hexamita inflata]